MKKQISKKQISLIANVLTPAGVLLLIAGSVAAQGGGVTAGPDSLAAPIMGPLALGLLALMLLVIAGRMMHRGTMPRGVTGAVLAGALLAGIAAVDAGGTNEAVFEGADCNKSTTKPFDPNSASSSDPVMVNNCANGLRISAISTPGCGGGGTITDPNEPCLVGAVVPGGTTCNLPVCDFN